MGLGVPEYQAEITADKQQDPLLYMDVYMVKTGINESVLGDTSIRDALTERYMAKGACNVLQLALWKPDAVQLTIGESKAGMKKWKNLHIEIGLSTGRCHRNKAMNRKLPRRGDWLYTKMVTGELALHKLLADII